MTKTQKANLNLQKPKPKLTENFKNCSYVWVSLCTTVVHNTAQNSSDNLASYPPDNHHCSDVVRWRGGRVLEAMKPKLHHRLQRIQTGI